MQGVQDQAEVGAQERVVMGAAQEPLGDGVGVRGVGVLVGVGRVGLLLLREGGEGLDEGVRVRELVGTAFGLHIVFYGSVEIKI